MDHVLSPLYRDLVTAINNADTAITLVVPSAVIVVCNVRTSIALSQFYRSIEASGLRRSSMVNSSLCMVNPAPPRRRHRSAADRRRPWSAQYDATYSNSSYNRLQMKVTKMLLLVSTVFLLLNIPSHAVRVYVFFKSTVDPSYVPNRLLVLVQKIMQHMFYVNFATNFLLYSVSGKSFRRATYRLAWCAMRRTTLWARRVRRRGRSSTPVVVIAQNIVVEPPPSPSPQQPAADSSSGELFGGFPLESPYN